MPSTSRFLSHWFPKPLRDAILSPTARIPILLTHLFSLVIRVDAMLQEVTDTDGLKLPECPIPRCGEEVCWFRGFTRRHGIMLGHNSRGLAVVQSDEGAQITCDFRELRARDPLNRLGPNWQRLPGEAKILRPSEEQLQRFKTLLDQRTPPGPRYSDLVTEIWARGFEVFLVGGTVRDVVSGEDSKDVDLVTTMPLALMRPLLRSMYNVEDKGSRSNGFIRIGGTPTSGDPFIDVKMFSNCFIGTQDALFGGGFESDRKHRDFACNAVYFDPINAVLIDPTGNGINHAIDKILQPICGTGDPRQMGHIYIRFAKFLMRGYKADEVVIQTMQVEYAACLGSLEMSEKVRYLTAQVVNKSTSDAAETLQVLRESMEKIGHDDVYRTHFAPAIERMTA